MSGSKSGSSPISLRLNKKVKKFDINNLKPQTELQLHNTTISIQQVSQNVAY